jgi:hypothetical protein
MTFDPTTIQENINLDDETLDFSEPVEIRDDEDIPELPSPKLDDFLTVYPKVETTLFDIIDLIGFNMWCWMLLREVDAINQLESAKYIQAQVRSMVPHIARFQRYHLWEENEWGQRIRNCHNVIHNRNIIQRWKT